MCTPSRPSYNPPPAPTPIPIEEKKKQAKVIRRVGKTLRTGSPSQRGRGVFIRSKSPLGIATSDLSRLGTRKSLLTAIPSPLPLTVQIGGY